jgi:hypothetical protein
MMNWKGFGRKITWLNFKAGLLSRHSPGVTEEKSEKLRLAGLQAVI